MKNLDLPGGLIRFTEGILAHRKRRIGKRREKQARRHWAVDWLDAFLWAVIAVLLINQYLLQAYQIPSGSMIDTLEINDRIFVNKLILGPELLPGAVKLPSPITADRGDVVIFENPTYLSKGLFFDILHRVVYMLTLSMVDIDRDPGGEPSPRFLIKRYVGSSGDRIRVDRGFFQFKPRGAEEWMGEEALKEGLDMGYTTQRRVQPADYDLIERAGALSAYSTYQQPPPAAWERDVQAISRMQKEGRRMDYYAMSQSQMETLHALAPQNKQYLYQQNSYDQGWYLPEGWILPLGDNRDNSRDGRYFGAIRLSNLLGRAMFIYWPPSRWGSIE